MKPCILVAPLLLSICGGIVLPSYAQAPVPQTLPAPNTVTKTFVLKHLLPLTAFALLKEGDSKKALLPAEITELVPRSDNRTLTAVGSPAAIAQLEDTIRYLDVKPRTVKVETKLIEIERTPDGKRKETVLQSPALTTANNNKVQFSVETGDRSTSVACTPHLNGDGSVTVQVELNVGRTMDLTKRSSDIKITHRLLKQRRWIAVADTSLYPDTGATARNNASDGPAPLYRLEVRATEVKD